MFKVLAARVVRENECFSKFFELCSDAVSSAFLETCVVYKYP
jgi:hypothetical protein